MNQHTRKESHEMNLPGFSAEASLYQTSGRYGNAAAGISLMDRSGHCRMRRINSKPSIPGIPMSAMTTLGAIFSTVLIFCV